MKILLASSSRTARIVIRGILEKDGIASGDIVEVGDHQEITAAFKSSKASPDLAVIDWGLPGIEPVALARQLRESSAKTGLLFCIKPADQPQVSEIAGLGRIDWIERPFANAAFLKKFGALREEAEKAKAGKTTRRRRMVAATEAPELALPFLLQLPSHLIDDLLRKSKRSRHAPGTILLRPGEIPEALHIVTRGEIEILEGNAEIRSRVSGEGDPFGELSFMTARPCEDTVRARSEVDVASVSKAELADVLRRHPRMSEYLSSLLSRHSKTMKARATTLSHADFKGMMDVTPFSDLIQLLGSTRKTGVLGFREDSRSGAIYLEDGEAVHAWTDDLTGEKAFFELATWRKARFAFRSIRRKEPKTLKTATMILLVEAMRLLDESSGQEPLPPSPKIVKRRPF